MKHLVILSMLLTAINVNAGEIYWKTSDNTATTINCDLFNISFNDFVDEKHFYFDNCDNNVFPNIKYDYSPLRYIIYIDNVARLSCPVINFEIDVSLNFELFLDCRDEIFKNGFEHN